MVETPERVQLNLSLEEQVVRLHALLEASRQIHATMAVSEVLSQTVSVLVRELEVRGARIVSATGETMVSFGVVPTEIDHTCVPFELRGKTGNVVAVLIVATGEGCGLSLYERDFIEGLIVQVAVALENAMLHERDLEWMRLSQDLNAARDIQRSLLPKAMPHVAGMSIAARSVTCYEVGGDYLDVLEHPDGSLLLMVADVAGKGLASAIVATGFRAAFRSIAAQDLPLGEVMRRIGQWHWEEGPEARRRYVTAILVRLDRERNCVEVVNAGHNPGILLQADGAVTSIQASGVPLGLLPGATYQVERFAFDAGARLLLYTDGLTEVFCGEDEFGCERLTELFRQMPTDDADAILEELWTTLHDFATGAPQTDDMTALAVCHQHAGAQEMLTA